MIYTLAVVGLALTRRASAASNQFGGSGCSAASMERLQREQARASCPARDLNQDARDAIANYIRSHPKCDPKAEITMIKELAPDIPSTIIDEEVTKSVYKYPIRVVATAVEDPKDILSRMYASVKFITRTRYWVKGTKIDVPPLTLMDGDVPDNDTCDGIIQCDNEYDDSDDEQTFWISTLWTEDWEGADEDKPQGVGEALLMGPMPYYHMNLELSAHNIKGDSRKHPYGFYKTCGFEATKNDKQVETDYNTNPNDYSEKVSMRFNGEVQGNKISRKDAQGVILRSWEYKKTDVVMPDGFQHKKSFVVMRYRRGKGTEVLCYVLYGVEKVKKDVKKDVKNDIELS